MVLELAACDLQMQPGNLHAEVRDNTLCIPAELAKEASKLDVRNAVDLIAFMSAFPSTVAEQLHWTVPDVVAATALLRQQLQTQLPEAMKRPQTHAEPSYGAMDPDLLSPTAAQNPLGSRGKGP